MKNAKEILEALYKVYDPKEIEENPDVLNEPFNSQEIRNIMMSYFMFNTLEDTLKGIREIINKMPDEWVVEFLKNQENTVVEKVNEAINEEITDDIHDKEKQVRTALKDCFGKLFTKIDLAGVNNAKPYRNLINKIADLGNDFGQIDDYVNSKIKDLDKEPEKKKEIDSWYDEKIQKIFKDVDKTIDEVKNINI